MRKAKREVMKQINILLKPYRPREKRSRPPKDDKKKEKEKKEKEKKDAKKSPREPKRSSVAGKAGGGGERGGKTGGRGGTRGRGGRGRGKGAAGRAGTAEGTATSHDRHGLSSFESRVRDAADESSARKRARIDEYHGNGPPPIHSVLSLQTAKLMPEIEGAAQRARGAVDDVHPGSFIGPVRIGLGGRVSLRVQHGGPDVEVGDIISCAPEAYVCPWNDLMCEESRLGLP